MDMVEVGEVGEDIYTGPHTYHLAVVAVVAEGKCYNSELQPDGYFPNSRHCEK